MLLSVVFNAQVGKEPEETSDFCFLFIYLCQENLSLPCTSKTEVQLSVNIWFLHSFEPGTKAQAPVALWQPMLAGPVLTSHPLCIFTERLLLLCFGVGNCLSVCDFSGPNHPLSKPLCTACPMKAQTSDTLWVLVSHLRHAAGGGTFVGATLAPHKPCSGCSCPPANLPIPPWAKLR